MFIDTHCHLDFFTPEEQGLLRERARRKNVGAMIVPSVSVSRFAAVKDATRFADCYAAYGLHPLYLAEHQPGDLQKLHQWISCERPIAIGECGLDFALEMDPKRQQYWFEAQVALALETDLPLLIHVRKSLEAVLQTLKQAPGVRFVIHSFSGSDQQLAQLLALGGYIGIGGTSTYPRAERLRRQLASIPEDRFLLETDAPDQPLAGHQGKTNEPAHVAEVAENLAVLRGCSPAQIAHLAHANCQKFFQTDF